MTDFRKESNQERLDNWNDDVKQIMALNHLLLDQGNFKLISMSLDQIIFGNSTYRLIFGYDCNRYGIRLFDSVWIEVPSKKQKFDCKHIIDCLVSEINIAQEFVKLTGRKLLKGGIIPTDLVSYSTLINKHLIDIFSSNNIKWCEQMKLYFQERYSTWQFYYNDH